MVNKRVWNAELGWNLKNGRMISVHCQGKAFNITVIQVYVPATSAEEAEVKWFFEYLQDLLELTATKDVLFSIRDWKAKVESQEIPRIAGKFGLGVQNCCCSVAQSCLTLQLHGLQHTRFPCPLLSPAICSNSCPLSWWCHPTISSSVVPFSSGPQSFPASGSFPMSQLFASGGQSIGASALASVLPMNIQTWFPLGLTDLISLQSKGLWQVFSSTTTLEYQFFSAQFSLWSNSHICTWLLEKHSFDYTDLCQQSDDCFFNMLSRFVLTFLPRSKCL